MSAPWKGKKLSEEHKARIRAGVLAAQAAGADLGNKGVSKPGSGSHPGFKHSEETKAKISDMLLGQQHTPERCANIAAAFTPERRERLAQNTFDGGQVAESFAAVLCPAGFVREHHVWFGHKIDASGKQNGSARLDFAHIEGLIAIELDGPSHNSTARSRKDFERDAILRALGWKIIRIKI